MLSRMKIFVNLFYLPYSNIGREEAIQGPLDRPDIHLASRLEVRYLAECMNPGIRSPGAEQSDGLSGEKSQFLFEDPLNGRTFELNLPSQIIRSVVFDEKLDVAHHSPKIAWSIEQSA